MIIDFHTHTFPEKIAEAAVSQLEKSGNTRRHTSGTNSSLMDSMKRSGVDVSVILPVVTNPAKTSHINQRAALINETSEETGLISFGGIHPLAENYIELLDECAALGIKGIKLHPDYYGVRFDDIRMKRIIYHASENGLIVITHAGIDVGLYPPECCDIESILDVMRDVAPEKLVLAHMGGWMNWQEVTDKLSHLPVWIDTAYSIGEIDWLDRENHKDYHMMSDEMFVTMVHAFGSEKILFATDSPWSDQEDYVNRIKNMNLSDEERDNIFSGNARKLLNI